MLVDKGNKCFASTWNDSESAVLLNLKGGGANFLRHRNKQPYREAPERSASKRCCASSRGPRGKPLFRHPSLQHTGQQRLQHVGYRPAMEEERERGGWREGRRERQTDRQTETETDTQTETKADTQTETSMMQHMADLNVNGNANGCGSSPLH